MKVIIGRLGHFEWACDELAEGLRGQLGGIYQVANEFKSRPGNKTICIVLCCPCCNASCLDALPERDKDTVWVTPFHGIDPAGCHITQIDVYPPYEKKDGKREAVDDRQFLDHWRQTIEKALAE